MLGPLTTLHVPTPTVGLFPPKFVMLVVVVHIDCVLLLVAVVGGLQLPIAWLVIKPLAPVNTRVVVVGVPLIVG